MGKWIARMHYGSNKWTVIKQNHEPKSWYNEDEAKRTATALNVADAGVDLGEARRIIQQADQIRDWYEKNQTWEYNEDTALAKLYEEVAEPFLTRIANAVEGDKTKEDV